MSQQDPPDSSSESIPELPAWDAASVLRQRAEDARVERDASVADLRRSLPDKEILSEFGIDLSQLED